MNAISLPPQSLTPRETEALQISHRFVQIVVGATIFLGFLYVTAISFDPDLGWRLRVGEWIITHRAIPRLDEFTHTMPGYAWVDPAWLGEAWLWWMYAHRLGWLLNFAFALLAAIPFFVWIRRARTVLELALILLAGLFIANYIGVRLHLFSFVLFFVVFEILKHEYVDRLPPSAAALWTLPLIFFAWANLHTGFMVGLILFGAFQAAQSFVAWRNSGRLDPRDLILRLPVFAASVAATFANVYGWRLHYDIFSALSSPNARYIMELRPASFALGIPGMLLIAFFGFFLFVFWNRYPLTLTLVSLVFFASFLKVVKTGPFFVITAMSLIGAGAQLVNQAVRDAPRRSPRLERAVKMLQEFRRPLLLVIVAFWVIFVARHQPYSLPERAAEFLRAQARRGETITLFNSYGWGGYLVWKAPEVKVFIDGRMFHWVDEDGSSAMADVIKVDSAHEDDWREVLARRNVNTVLTGNTDTYASSEVVLGFLMERLLPTAAREWFDHRVLTESIREFLYGTSRDSLKTVLLRNNWEIIYKDDLAVILRCRPEPCWSGNKQ